MGFIFNKIIQEKKVSADKTLECKNSMTGWRGMHWPYNFNSLLMKLCPCHVQLCNHNTFSYYPTHDPTHHVRTFYVDCEGLRSILLDSLCTLRLNGNCFLHFLGNSRSTISELFPSKIELKETCKHLPGTRIIWDLSFTWEPQTLELGEFSGKDMMWYLGWFQ